jgi:collagenase-like PrtC family protease
MPRPFDGLRISSWAVPLIVAAIVAAAMTRAQLDNKEDQADHEHDINVVQTGLALVKAEGRERAIRDSARIEDLYRMTRDEVCSKPANQYKSYCKGP